MVGLVSDIGGTNARFALVESPAERPALLETWSTPCAAFVTAEDAIDAYLARVGQRALVWGVFATAGPVRDGAVHLTNASWTLSKDRLERRLGAPVELLNDFQALGWSTTALDSHGAIEIGGPHPQCGRETRVVLGPGTGFGAAALVPCGEGWVALATEAGHSALAPANHRDLEVLSHLRGVSPHVSWETILSGAGLARLHAALPAADDTGMGPSLQAPEITRRALAGDGRCRATVDRFWSITASAAGDLALVYGGRGGVWLAGGILPRVQSLLDPAKFRTAFEAKGPMTPYLQAIPTRLIVEPHASLIGAAQFAMASWPDR